jgi:hypothetical protein
MAFFFKTLYQWTTAYDCHHISDFLDFLDLFSFPGEVFLLSSYGCTLLLFNKFLSLIKEYLTQNKLFIHIL